MTLNFDGAKEAHTYLLADGGVTDNTGIQALVALGWQQEQYARFAKNSPEDTTVKAEARTLEAWRPRGLLASDAGAALRELYRPGPRILDASRAVDIIYSNIGPPIRAENETLPPMILVKPEERLFTIQSVATGEIHPLEYLFSGVTSVNGSDFQRLNTAIEAADMASLDFLARTVSNRKLDDDNKEELRGLGIATDIGGLTTFTMAADALTRRLSASPCDRRARLALRSIIASDLFKDSESFVNTPTLDDQPTRDAAEALFRHGRQLVAINWPYIQAMASGRRIPGEYEIKPECPPGNLDRYAAATIAQSKYASRVDRASCSSGPLSKSLECGIGGRSSSTSATGKISPLERGGAEGHVEPNAGSRRELPERPVVASASGTVANPMHAARLVEERKPSGRSLKSATMYHTPARVLSGPRDAQWALSDARGGGGRARDPRRYLG